MMHTGSLLFDSGLDFECSDRCSCTGWQAWGVGIGISHFPLPPSQDAGTATDFGMWHWHCFHAMLSPLPPPSQAALFSPPSSPFLGCENLHPAFFTIYTACCSWMLLLESSGWSPSATACLIPLAEAEHLAWHGMVSLTRELQW